MQWTTENYEAQVGPTVGANYQRKTISVNGQSLDLYLWDTAGQEQFHALAPLYAHSASCAVIVVAIDDPASFRGIPSWTNLINQSCDTPPPPMMLFVNKMDKARSVGVSIEEIKERYKDMFPAIFFVSASSGEGVDPAFNHAGECAYHFLTENTQLQRRSRLGSDEPRKCC
jgi:small GTP-binding protein